MLVLYPINLKMREFCKHLDKALIASNGFFPYQRHKRQ
ncbi:hypothetical protein PALB_15910 [Pseudoalteromonas luteoviolacea B = ATCC 29581]|nr:hypothetical protein PALB_15910 [Pseudoalteromonas luteoviolacea B = ATCC 29581]